VTRLSPRKYLGQMMGLWFISISVGNLFAGLIAGRFDAESLPDMPGMFMYIFAWTAGPGVLLVLLARWLRKLQGPEEVTFHGDVQPHAPLPPEQADGGPGRG